MYDETLDVVNQMDEIVGCEKRSIVHKTGLWHRGIHIFAFTPNNQLVIQIRGEHQDKYPGTLDCSVSEHIKSGESYIDGAVRGMHEELGLRIGSHLLYPIMRFRMRYGADDNMISEVYETFVDAPTGLTVSNEAKEIRYYEVAELMTMIQNNTQPFSYWFVQMLEHFSGHKSALEIVKFYNAPHKL